MELQYRVREKERGRKGKESGRDDIKRGSGKKVK
jgi:hypothetical protein